MLVIFGNNLKEYIEADGKFHCPKCKFMQVYNVKTTKNYFQLFFISLIFISLIPIGDKSQPFVECQRCKNHWDTSVLENNNFYLDETPVNS